jgi:hypothetical protein
MKERIDEIFVQIAMEKKIEKGETIEHERWERERERERELTVEWVGGVRVWLDSVRRW